MTGIALDGKTAVVTGGGRGIGRDVGRGLASEGVRVVLAARTEAEISEAAAEIRERGGEALAIPTDVTDADDVADLFGRTRDEYGRADLLVNNAGVSTTGKLWELSDDEWERVLDVNLTGTFRCTREALDGGMLERDAGTIINLSSLAGKIGFAGTTAYGASKRGVQGLTNALAKELKETDVRVSSVCPGQVRTDMTDSIAAVDRLDSADITDVVVFLATRPPAAYVPEIVVVPPESIPLVRH